MIVVREDTVYLTSNMTVTYNNSSIQERYLSEKEKYVIFKDESKNEFFIETIIFFNTIKPATII